MSYNPLERLKKGNVDFVYDLTLYDNDWLIDTVRKSSDRIEIINGFLSKLKENYPSFCFNIIYDIPEFADYAYEMICKKDNIFKWITPEKFSNMLYNSPLGYRLLEEDFEKFIYALREDEERSECRTEDDDLTDLVYLEKVIEYAFDSNDTKLLYRLSRYEDLHIRSLFMEYLIKNHPDKIDEIYNDITKYMTSVTYEPLEQLTYLPIPMKQEKISKIAVQLLTNGRKEDYETLKDFILREYKYNNLASELLTPPRKEHPTISFTSVVDTEKLAIQEAAFKKDADKLFTSSKNYRFHILFDHSAEVRKELLDEFSYRMRYFINEKETSKYSTEKWALRTIDNSGLDDLLEEWIEKYMDLSQSKEYGFIGRGTTCDCYRIGDYVIKLIKRKYCYEDVICPDLYLIVKNYEEIYVRARDGFVTGGLEVQKYLTRSVKDIDPKYFGYFDKALDRLGYRRCDTLTGGECGENVMLLDSYRDADCPNPEKVPVWFRKYPIVLIDRDLVYPKDQKYVKQLGCDY